MLKIATIATSVAAILASAAPAWAKAAEATSVMSLVQSPATLSPGRYVWEDDASLGPVGILISIPEQRAYVYRGRTIVAVSSVSTGKGSKPTPTGVFTILQKAEVHRSSLYNSASMPYMQRLTWGGVAMHAGHNPGFPASHGCIRLPSAFAKQLYQATEKGATVEIVNTPVFGGAPAPMPAPMNDAPVIAVANLDTPEMLDTSLASR